MPAVRMDKMRRNYEENKRSGEFWTPAEGDTKVYVHPPCRAEDNFEPTEGLNYIPVTVHYGVGKNNQMVVCTDAKRNPIVQHPFVRALLKKSGKKLDGTCKVCGEIADGSMSPEEIDRSKAQTRYLWGVTPMSYRADPGDEWKKLAPKPSVIFAGKMLYDGLMELYFDIGDISEPDGAVYAKIHREGKGKMDTRYKVSADMDTVKKPVKIEALEKTSRALAKAVTEGGDCDLFKVVANMVKSPSEQSAILSGVKIAEDDSDDADVDEAEEKPTKKAPKPEPEADEEDDEAEVDKPADSDEEDDEDELPKPKPKVKPKPEPEEDEEPEAEDEPEAEADEDEPAPKTKVKPKAKPEPEAEEDEPEAEADEEPEAEEDEKPAAKPKPKAKPEAAADEGDELDKLDAELDRLSKKKAGKK